MKKHTKNRHKKLSEAAPALKEIAKEKKLNLTKTKDFSKALSILEERSANVF